MHTLIARLDAALAASCPTLYEMLGPGSPKEDLDELEQLFGMPLPELYREFLAWRGPNRAEDSEGDIHVSIFTLTTARRAIGKLQMMRDLWAGEPGWRESGWWGEFYLPLMEHGGPELVIDVAVETRLKDDEDSSEPFHSIPGQVMEFHHADEFRDVHAPSLDVWLEALAITFERKLVEEYTWDDESGRGAEVEVDEPFDKVLGELAPSYPRYLPVLHQPEEFW